MSSAVTQPYRLSSSAIQHLDFTRIDFAKLPIFENQKQETLTFITSKGNGNIIAGQRIKSRKKKH